MTTEKRTPIVVTKSEFTTKVAEGLTKSELSGYFGISKLAATKFAKELNLKIKITRTGSTKYQLVNDDPMEPPMDPDTELDINGEPISNELLEAATF